MSFRRLRIVYSAPAREDIANILDYTELEWGPEQVKQYRAQLRESIRRLAEIPSLGRAREDLAPGLQVFPVGSHLVCYLVRDDNLLIARVLHGRQDALSIDWPASGQRIGESES